MKRLRIICLIIIVLLPTLAMATIAPARISSLAGDIAIRTPESDDWLPATVNTPLDEGDSIWASDDGRVELQLPDGSVLRLDGGSQIDLVANEDGFIHLHLESGRIYLKTIQGMRDNTLQIDADDTTVLPAGRTRLRIDMLPDSLEDVAILKGSAYVEGNGSRTRVRAGEHIVLDERYSKIHPLNPADDWELWNLDRDREQARAAKANGHLPDELRPYAAEMDANGTWVSVPEYGSVWRPTVDVAADWAPYREGRWIWKGDDYVWISYEPWGWVPYHFGRWAVVAGFGWCWVPPVRGDVYWGPGYVGWYRTGDYIGWTPLAPGETFYGRRYYGRNSVNITTVNVNTTTIVYRNRQHRGGMTVLPHNDFLHGRHGTPRGGVRIPDSLPVAAGSPRIQPVRETRMPIVKQTPPRPSTPARDRQDQREVRDRFPRVMPEVDQRGRQPQASSPSTVTPAVSVRPGIRTERERDGIRQHTPKEQAMPSVQQPSPREGKPRGEERPNRDDSRRTTSGGKPVPQIQPPQRSDDGKVTMPPAQPAGLGNKPAGTAVVPTVNGRSGEDRRRSGSYPTPGTTIRPTANPPRSDERQNGSVLVTPPRGDKPQGSPPSPAAGSRAPSTQRGDQPRHDAPASKDEPRKVWRVTTPDATPGSVQSPIPASAPAQERDGRGRERR